MKFKYIGDKPYTYDKKVWNPGDIKEVANEKAFTKVKMFVRVEDEPVKKPKKKAFGKKKKSE